MNNGVDEKKLEAMGVVQCVKSWGIKNVDALRALIPEGTVSTNRFLQSAIIAIAKSPKILACTPLSVIAALKEIANYGLEVGGLLDQAYLIPYKDKCQAQLGYKGIISLARRSKQIKSICVQTVFTNDTCEIDLGAGYVKHIIALDGDRGAARGYYAKVVLDNGEVLLSYMSKAEVERHRRTFSKAPDSDAWLKSYDEMAKKTVMRRILKLCPISIEALEAISSDEKKECMQPEEVPINNTQAVKEQKIKSNDVIDMDAINVDVQEDDTQKTLPQRAPDSNSNRAINRVPLCKEYQDAIKKGARIDPYSITDIKKLTILAKSMMKNITGDDEIMANRLIEEQNIAGMQNILAIAWQSNFVQQKKERDELDKGVSEAFDA